MSTAGSEREAQAAPGPLSELNVESRLLLAFAAPAAAVQQLLPTGWQSAPPQQGPVQGANLLLVVADRLLVQGADGTPAAEQATNQLAVLAVPAASAGRAGLIIAYGLSARPAGAPGPYSVFEAATAAVDRRITLGNGDHCEESWRLTGPADEAIEVRAAYERGVPVRSETQTFAYSRSDPSFVRLYVADQGADVLQTGGVSGERLKAIEVSSSGPRLAVLSSTDARLLSVVSIPWTVRRAFLIQPA